MHACNNIILLLFSHNYSLSGNNIGNTGAQALLAKDLKHCANMKELE